MSDILIRGMEMPTSCPCELLGIGYDLYCSFAGGIPARVKEYYECCQNGTRPSWCPLVYVPEHGRLIDADALMLEIQEYIEEYSWETDEHGWHNEKWCAMKEAAMAIDAAPTIIEAEEGE